MEEGGTIPRKQLRDGVSKTKKSGESAQKDRIYHRFLWRNLDSSGEPYVYEFQRLVFGNTASPFIAQFVLQKHAKDNAQDYREATGTVSDSMYVDDVLDSHETSKDVIEL